MTKCKTPTCQVQLAAGSKSTRVHDGICSRCRSSALKDVYEVACATIPSLRTRLEWESIRDTVAGKMRCYLAQGESVRALEHIHTQAVGALSAMPVSICPIELARLQRRDTQLHLIEVEARHCIRQPDPGVDIAGRFVLWLQQSNILRGQRF